MSNPVSQYGPLAKPDSLSRSASDKTDKKNGAQAVGGVGAEPVGAGAPAAPPAPQDDILNLSNITQRVRAEPEFDRAKVDAIKNAIKNGQYPLNPRRIAESFVALEQLIRD